MDLSEKTFTYAAVGIGVFGIFMVFTNAMWLGLFVVPLILIGALSAGLSYVLYQFGYFILPMITTRLGVRENMGDGYIIPPTQDVVVRQTSGIYQAISFVGLKLYEAATSGVEEETESQYMELWERALTTFRFPVKVAIISYLEDVVKYRERIETQRAAAQIKIGKEREKPNPDALTIDKWEREVARMNDKLEKLTSGEKPMGLVMYAATSAAGVNEVAAVAAVRKQADELRSVVGNALNVETFPLNGEDMKKCFRWERVIPPEPAKFAAEV